MAGRGSVCYIYRCLERECLSPEQGFSRPTRGEQLLRGRLWLTESWGQEVGTRTMKRGLFALRMQKTWSDLRNPEKISRELFGVRVQIFGWFIFRLVVKEG